MYFSLAKNLESLINIKFNGPPVEQFNALKYAKSFVEKYKYVDASPRKQQVKRLQIITSKEDQDAMEEEDDIHFSQTIIY